ncbi:MAG TPA: hypothetical protein VL793_08075, partial [Patescibacteria group bacterium]|nr:hypothetical protein [Patescibacteria group bacterium]
MKNKLKPTVTEQLSARRRFRTVLVGGSLAVVALVALFYAEEDWRGRLAWARAKRELSARGGVLVRAAPLPTKIPDELNVLKAPRMSEWFLSHEPTDLMTRLNGGNSWTHPERQRLVDITFVSLTNDPSTFPGLCLDYNAPMLAPADPHWKGAPPSSSSVVFPLIVMEDVPLPDAIKNLARQAQRNHSFDSNLTWQFTRSSLDPSATPPSTTPRNSRTPPPPVLVNVRWQNVTAFQALMVLLANHNLAWTEDFTNHVGLISMRSADTPLVQVLTSAREQL